MYLHRSEQDDCILQQSIQKFNTHTKITFISFNTIEYKKLSNKMIA